MAQIPSSILRGESLLHGLKRLKLRHRGKVRDSYELPGCPEQMLLVASNRCSIFDFVLPTQIPQKGEVLTALNHFWTAEVLGDICQTDFVACGASIDTYLPEKLRCCVELQKRSTVVRVVPTPDVEDIVRIILTGSGWTSYQETGVICGHRLPPGLKNGTLLPYPIYTPTTKAELGHDEHVTADSVVRKYGHLRERLALQAAGAIASYAARRGIMMADTKFEFSLNGDGLVLADEKGTPDSSRFVDEAVWIKALKKGQFPPSLDKQYVREWGKQLGIDKRDPKNSDDVAYVHSQEMPPNVVDITRRLYRYIFWRLTGLQIEIYQHKKMGIDTHPSKPKIEILIGSESDLAQTELGVASLLGIAVGNITVISCHRNVLDLSQFVQERITKADVIIAGAGMAAALPGILKSQLCALHHPEIPVIGVAFKGDSEKDNQAAILSIECLPGHPVELDPTGHAYFGAEGFLAACQAAVSHEFLPKGLESKPAKIDFKTI